MTVRDLERLILTYITIEIIQLIDGELLYRGAFHDLVGSLWYEKVHMIFPNDYAVLQVYV